jgi:hypothetical protein
MISTGWNRKNGNRKIETVAVRKSAWISGINMRKPKVHLASTDKET